MIATSNRPAARKSTDNCEASSRLLRRTFALQSEGPMQAEA